MEEEGQNSHLSSNFINIRPGVLREPENRHFYLQLRIIEMRAEITLRGGMASLPPPPPPPLTQLKTNTIPPDIQWILLLRLAPAGWPREVKREVTECSNVVMFQC